MHATLTIGWSDDERRRQWRTHATLDADPPAHCAIITARVQMEMQLTPCTRCSQQSERTLAGANHDGWMDDCGWLAGWIQSVNGVTVAQRRALLTVGGRGNAHMEKRTEPETHQSAVDCNETSAFEM